MREFLFSFLARHLSTVTTEFFPLLPPCRVDPKASSGFLPPPLKFQILNRFFHLQNMSHSRKVPFRIPRKLSYFALYSLCPFSRLAPSIWCRQMGFPGKKKSERGKRTKNSRWPRRNFSLSEEKGKDNVDKTLAKESGEEEEKKKRRIGPINLHCVSGPESLVTQRKLFSLHNGVELQDTTFFRLFKPEKKNPEIREILVRMTANMIGWERDPPLTPAVRKRRRRDVFKEGKNYPKPRALQGRNFYKSGYVCCPPPGGGIRFDCFYPDPYVAKTFDLSFSFLIRYIPGHYPHFPGKGKRKEKLRERP